MGNILLEGLAAQDRALIAPHFVQHPMRRGDVLIGHGQPLDHFYFPERMVLSISGGEGAGSATEIGVVGREGVIGWPALLGCRTSSYQARVRLGDGVAIAVPARIMLDACERSAGLMLAMLRFVQTLTDQMAGTIISGQRDPVERRLCRWLLMRHDRIDGDELRIGHEEVSGDLGLRRATVTDHLHLLEGNRLVRCHRGRIAIRNRLGLEAIAGSAYGVAEAAYASLIAPFGKRATVH